VTFFWSFKGSREMSAPMTGRGGSWSLDLSGLPLDNPVSFRAEAVSVDGVRASSATGTQLVRSCVIG
jgi:hypothetical protein